jgi:RNA polymerase sigma-70 factor (ECF subfamily)
MMAFPRRDGRLEEEAREMAHAFFAGVLEGGLGTPDQARGRFRSYLVGGGETFSFQASGGCEGVLDDARRFDREWAFTVIARALATLEAEHEAKRECFQTLKPWLDGAADVSQAHLAATFGISETAVKVAIHRLRARFRELIRAEVAATVSDPNETAEELRHLIAIVSRG